ncbi:hypothetical protein [Wenzhouxiangella sediminis]|uniref:Uncharacterized protein n=1 Tax=Wenzhouxiangella sediminis TaxID=1792836 RepID=A0A3E1KD26_9GAMM|nr:hypothetical protein [Wenzhouxiangella sediminis]RFF33005.1 hypothetical protein DZC52_00130 [Wenzhouxiangella sediminis]
MRQEFAGRFVRVALCGLAALLAAAPATAELVGLVHDTADGSLQAVAINSDTGAVTPAGASAADCCLVPTGLSVTDTAGERFFVVGEWTAGATAGSTSLHELGFDGLLVNSVVLAEVPRSVLAWDDQNARLISLRHEPETTLLAIDPVSGAVSTLGGAQTDCCEVIAGVSAIDSAGQRLFVAGRSFGATDWSLLEFDLGSGAVSEAAVLPTGRPGFMLYDSATGRVEVMMQTALADSGSLVAIDPATATLDTLATYSNGDCCLYAPGDGASRSDDGEVIWAAGIGGASAAGFFGQFALGLDRPVDIQPMDAGYHMLALVVDGSTVVPGILFRDRFEQP